MILSALCFGWFHIRPGSFVSVKHSKGGVCSCSLGLTPSTFHRRLSHVLLVFYSLTSFPGKLLFCGANLGSEVDSRWKFRRSRSGFYLRYSRGLLSVPRMRHRRAMFYVSCMVELEFRSAGYMLRAQNRTRATSVGGECSHHCSPIYIYGQFHFRLLRPSFL